MLRQSALARLRRGPLALSASDWLYVLRGVWAQLERTNLALIAAGVAFFGLMAAIPGLAALIALLGLFGDPALVGEQIAAMRGVAPAAALTIVQAEVLRLLHLNSGALATGALFNLILSLWSALQGVRWTLIALTLVNRRAEPRTFLRRYVAAGAFTLYALGLALAAILLMGLAPLLLTLANIGPSAETIILLLRWPILGGAGLAVALIFYRWGPHRRAPAWRWLWPGACAACILWVAASSAFTLALELFPSFGAAYGSLASVVSLLIWLYLTALIFLLGGALNAELEFYAHGAPTPPVRADEKVKIAATPAPKPPAPD